jgi:hypothetical protein
MLTQDRCKVCAKHTIGSKIILDAPDGTPRGHGSCGVLARLRMLLASVHDRCPVCAKHTLWSEIILDAPVGNLR